MNEQQPLAKRKLAELIEERLLEQIQSGEMAPGDLFPSERELMERFQVGRPAIREAMQKLQHMGLVDIRHGERPRVATPSLDRAIYELGQTMRHLLTHSEGSLEHLKQARVLFETEITRTAARQRTDEDLDRLQEILAAQRRAAERPGVPAYSTDFMRLDGEFHAEIATISGNPIFRSLSRALFAWLSNFHAHLVRRPGLEELTMNEHAEILDAIRDQDPELAASRMHDHLERANSLYLSTNLSRPRDN